MADGPKSSESAAIRIIVATMKWAYRHAVDGDLPGLVGAATLAEEYRKSSANAEDAIDALIKRQTMNAGAVGFLSGVGGAFTLPASISANLASVLYLQLRMIAAVAHLRGHDIGSHRVEAVVIACMVGSSATDTLKDVGINVGTKMTERAIQRLSTAALNRLNTAVGMKLIAKAGSAGIANMAKFVPIAGGLFAGAFDAATTRAVGAIAKKLFAPLPPPEAEGAGPELIEGQILLPAKTAH